MADSPNIKVSGSLDDSQMVKAFEDQARAMAKVVQSLQKLADGGTKVEKAYKGIDEATRKATAEQEKFLRQGQRVTKEMEVPLERYNRKVEELQGLLKKGAISQETFRRAAEKSKKEFEGTSQAIDHGVVGLGKMVIAGGIVYKTAQSIRAEWERVVALQNKAAAKQAGQGMSFARLRVNYTPDKTVKNDKELESHVQRLAKKHGIKDDMVRQILGAGFSSAGTATNLQVINTADAAMGVIPGDPLAPIELTAGSLQLQQLAKVGPRRSLGFQRQVMQRALVRSLPKLNETMTPVISAEVAAGGTAETGGELFALSTHLGADSKGESSSTAAISLINALKGYVPERTSKDRLGKPLRVAKALRDEYLGAKSSVARLALLQQNPNLAEQFLMGHKFEARFQAPYEKLVRGDAGTMKLYGSIKAGIDSPNAPGQAERFEKFVNADFPGKKIFEATRKVDNAADPFHLGLDRAARVAISRKALNSVIDDTNIAYGPDAPARVARRSNFEAMVIRGQDPERAAIREMERIKEGRGILNRAADADERKNIDRHIVILEKLLESSQKTEQNTRPKTQKEGQAEIESITKRLLPNMPQYVPPAAKALGRNP